MRVIDSPAEMAAISRAESAAGRRIGFVPTMGWLHEGHLSLVRAARARADRVVLSVFVNPTQFGPGEDFLCYPRDLERDRALAESCGVDWLFAPAADRMYPMGHRSVVVVEGLEKVLCGASRPGHFRGVATVVLKLLNIVAPAVAVFGEKDYQQLVIVRRMVRDLDVPTEIVGSPIVREADGLAMSSRNVRLGPAERTAARVLSRALAAARAAFDSGERQADRLLAIVRDELAREPLCEVDYVALVDAGELEPVERIAAPALLALAARFGGVRLIDNAVLAPQPEGR